MIISRTPFRISFFGGGTDYPPYYLEHGGAVLSTSFDKYCYITCRSLPPFFEHKYRIAYSQIENAKDHDDIQHPAVREVLRDLGVDEGLEIHCDADLPARSGLGSSSAFVAGLVNAIYALKGKMISQQDLAREAIRFEQEVLQENVGSQDQVATAVGGLNTIYFKQDGSFEIEPLVISKERKTELQSNLMLFFTGFSRIASTIAKSQIDNIDNKLTELGYMKAMVSDAKEILHSGAPIDEFGALLHQGWQYKRSLTKDISNPQIDDIYTAARNAGAIGGKLLGAGGGGFILFFVPPENQDAVKSALNGLVHVPFNFEDSGSKIIYYQPD